MFQTITPQLEVLSRGVNCPRCGAGSDEPCVTPGAGRVLAKPAKHLHTARVDRAVRLHMSNANH